MPSIYKLESDTHASIHGLAVQFDADKPAVKTQWEHKAPLSRDDCLALAKDCASHTLNHLLGHGRGAEADACNWPSVVAAMQRHIMDVNDAVKARAYGDIAPSAAIEGGGGAGDTRIH